MVMNPLTTSEAAIYLIPVLLVVIGFMTKNWLGKLEKTLEKLVESLHLHIDKNNEEHKKFITHDACVDCKDVAKERRIGCRENIEKLERTDNSLKECIDELNRCVNKITPGCV